METITVARLLKPFALRGEIHAISLTEFPKDRFKKGRTFYAVKDGMTPIPLTLKSVRGQGDAYLFSFEEIHSVEEAETLKGADLNMNKDEASLPDGYFRYADLIGCKAYDEEGNLLGEVLSVAEFAPTKNLKIKRADNGKPFYVPFIEAFVKTIDVEAKRIEIHVVEGML
ncbi:MAG: ribosome maturation factor RimM [Candidatus Enteromonas sp.]